MTDHPRRPHRMRWWAALMMAATVLCTVLASVVVIAATTARSSTVVADETVQRIGERTADLVLGHLDDAIETTAELEVLLGPDLLAERGPELDRLLAAQVHTLSQLSGAFVGFPDGAFRFVSRSGDGLTLRRIDVAPTRIAIDAPIADDLSIGESARVTTDYDPRERPWYEAALTGEGANWTSPYVFFSSGAPGVTVSRRVTSDRGELLAVIGIDVQLAELERLLDGLPIGERAEAFITAGDVIVAAPSGYESTRIGDDGDIELGEIDQLGVERSDLRQLVLEGRPLVTTDGGRLHMIELRGNDAPRWAVLIRTEQPAESESVDRWARWAIFAVVLTGLLMVASLPLITRSLRRAIDDLDHRARVDPLTHVLNRGALLDVARDALDDAQRLDREIAVAIVDVDDFKQVNDVLGHQRGDEMLSQIGQALAASVRPIDLVGRLGGDEFAVVISGLERPQVDAILQRIQRSLSHQGVTDPDRPTTTVTIGAAMATGRDLELRELLAEADAELIAAKRSRKGTIRWAAATQPLTGA